MSQLRPVMKSLMETKLEPYSSTPKIYSHKKWSHIIISAVENLKSKYPGDKLLIADLSTIARAIPEEYLVEATLGINQFKPQFIEHRPLLENTLSTLSESYIKAAKYKNEKKTDDADFGLNISVTEKTLTEEFEKKYHPFRFLIKNIRNLLELKYKSLIDKQKINLQKLQFQIRKDISICTQFMHYTSQPYKELFKCKDEIQMGKLSQKFDRFFSSYIKNHSKIVSTIHKIILYYSRAHYSQKITEQLPDISTPSEYTIPEQFQIDGCYIRSMSSLIDFSSYDIKTTPDKLLSKLIEFRKNILNDIDEYYLTKEGDTKQLELNAEIQIEIIRFIVGKLKGWACQIYAELKFLENFYGEQDIAFKYEEASFMYAQLSMSFEILGFQ